MQLYGSVCHPEWNLEAIRPVGEEGKIQVETGKGGKRRTVEINVFNGIIARLTRECGGNVDHCRVADVTCGFFGSETIRDSLPSGGWNVDPKWAAKNAAISCFYSAYRDPEEEDISHPRNN
jgi:hypothetical protein